jgi:hypothetical protein
MIYDTGIRSLRAMFVMDQWKKETQKNLAQKGRVH